MRARVLIPALLALFASASAQAAVEISINKDTQTMIVAVDGVVRHRWPVSSGLPAYETPNGVHKAFRMEEDHYSREWDEAPMPHSIFFTKKGHAIHGTDAVSRLGNPASHGCVRLSRANAATLFELVRAEGVFSTTVTLTGSSQVALARGPQRRNDIARANPQAGDGQVYNDARQLPPPQRITPDAAERGGYYDEYGRWVPGDGRTYRRSYQAQSPYAEQQPYAQQRPYTQQPRYYGQQQYPQPQYYYQQQPYQQQYQGTYGNPYYAQPRTYYRQPYDGYGN